MRFPSELIEGRLLRRYKRFLCDVELADGNVVTAHCANPGSMKTCLEESGRVWLSESTNPKRRLRYTWELAQVGNARIFVNPIAANKVVAEGLGRQVIRELQHYSELKSEVRWGASRIDFLLRRGDQRCYLEVKNVTLSLGAGRTAFPDSVTDRGARHLKELIGVKQAGHRAVLLFCVSRSDAKSAEAAVDIDPSYAEWLGRARASGVEVLAYKCRITKRAVVLAQPLPVLTPS